MAGIVFYDDDDFVILKYSRLNLEIGCYSRYAGSGVYDIDARATNGSECRSRRSLQRMFLEIQSRANSMTIRGLASGQNPYLLPSNR